MSDRSRAGEAVDRAGQLRMLSQRLVLCYAQALAGYEPEQPRQVIGDCIERVEANLGILRRAISTKGYGDMVERVRRSWEAARPICQQAPLASKLAVLDSCSEQMLIDAESLTGSSRGRR